MFLALVWMGHNWLSDLEVGTFGIIPVADLVCYLHQSSCFVLKGQVHGSAHAHLSKYAVLQLGHAVSSMQPIWSCHNVVKEPICTLPWQSLALDQLIYLQIAVN